jgi:hypothetical protein
VGNDAGLGDLSSPSPRGPFTPQTPGLAFSPYGTMPASSPASYSGMLQDGALFTSCDANL